MSYSLKDALFSLSGDDDDSIDNNLTAGRQSSTADNAAGRVPAVPAITQTQTDLEEYSSPVRSSSFPVVAATTTTAAAAATSHRRVSSPKELKQKLRIPIMRGTFIETTRWDEEAEETVRQHILQGTWKYNDDDNTTQNTTTNKNTEQPFELIRTVPGYEENTTTPRAQGDDDDDEEDTRLSPFFMPSNGLYNGSFGLAYQHTTPKGKRSMKSTTILEENVKLEFRKLWTTAGAGAAAATTTSSTTAADTTDAHTTTPTTTNLDTNFYYRIQGSGSNTIGHFSLGGTAKPCVATHQNKNNTYRIEIRRSYYGIHDPTAMTNEDKTGGTIASSSSSSYPTYASSLLHSQKQSLIKAESKRTATATGTAPTAAKASTIAHVAEADADATSTSRTTNTSSTTEQPAQKDQQREEQILAVAAEAPAPPSTPPVSPSSVSQYKQARLEKEEQLRKQKRLQQWRQRLLQKQQQEREREESLQQQQQQQHDTTDPQHQIDRYLANTTSNGVDRVNGKGMWHAWTRSFDTPLLALLDLFDNAVDASWTLLPKGDGDDDDDDDTANTAAHNTKQRTTAVTKPKISVELDTIGRNGVVMRNGSDFIPSLKQVLQVYKSQKTGDWDNSIGENGIGVKHACAALSTLSLVFTKTKSSSSSSSSSTYLSMGILMEGLQREEGIVLPSRDWKLTDSMETIKQELELICEREPFVWGKAVANYGDSNDLHDGIDKCLRHFELLRTHRDWKDCDNVFAVVLTDLKHAANDADTSGLVGNVDSNDTTDDNMIIDASSTMEPAMTTRHNANHDNKDKSTTTAAASSYHVVNGDGEEEEDEDKQRSVSLLNDLRNKLPYLYLHLHDLDVAVGNKPIESIFWERRLSELSKFELQISQTKLWSTVPKHFYNLESDDPQSVFHVSIPKETIRFFCGFDPYRCQTLYPKDAEHDKEESLFSYTPGDDINGATGGTGNNAALRVYLYSRQSGRLIKFKTDPRNELGLSAGSTDFCQGMTIIVDDHNGTLPLNPTKQDTAYGHSKYGQIHAANLKEWEAAIAHFYWHYHFSRLGGGKGAITQAVSKSKSALEDAYENYLTNYDDIEHDDDTPLLLPSLVPLCQGKFITFGQIDFALSSYRGHLKGIRAGKSARESCVPSINCNEVVRLNEDAAAIAIEGSGKKRKQAQKTSTPSSSDKNNSGLMGFSQQQSQSQLHLQQHYQSSLENAVTTPVSTSKRLRSSQDENGDLERLFQDERQQQQQQQQNLEQQELQRLNQLSMVHSNGHNSSSHQAGSMVMVHRLNQFANRNRQLERQVQVQGQNIQYLQSEIEKQKVEKLADDKKIAGLTLERDKWRKYGQSKTGEANKLLDASKRQATQIRKLQQQLLDASKRQALQIQKLQQQSGGREDVVDLTDGDNETKKEAEEELSKLRRLVDSYKSSASFYQKENDAKKQQIENLMEEKARFEERVKHLETSQLDDVDL